MNIVVRVRGNSFLVIFVSQIKIFLGHFVCDVLAVYINILVRYHRFAGGRAHRNASRQHTRSSSMMTIQRRRRRQNKESDKRRGFT